MGVEKIITFDAHDSRVQNAIPNNGFDNFFTTYQFISEILSTNPDLNVDPDHLMMISPDEGQFAFTVKTFSAAHRIRSEEHTSELQSH